MKLVLAVALLLAVVACGDAATTSPPTVATTAPATTAPAATDSASTTESTTTVTTLPPSTTSTTTTTLDPNAPIVVTVAFAAGSVEGPGRVEVDKGDTVELTVTSDVAEEIHVHGYDIFGDVAAGGTVVLSFEASIQGIFEVELEGSHIELLELVVS